MAPLTSWILIQLYSLNREAGEIRVQIEGTTKQQEQLKAALERLADQVSEGQSQSSD